jgi:hypothetical protein
MDLYRPVIPVINDKLQILICFEIMGGCQSASMGKIFKIEITPFERAFIEIPVRNNYYIFMSYK